MSIQYTRAQRRQLARDNAKQPDALTEVPRDAWPDDPPVGLFRVYRSKRFLVQHFIVDHAVARLSISRTNIDGDRWQDGITWDELQQIKRECGFGDLDAVEVFPADRDVVNVANMRHLWIMERPLLFAWRNDALD